MTVKDVVALVETIAPPVLAEEWDNVGLQAGAWDARVSRVLLAVDAGPDTVQQAAALGCDLIIAHHPVIFRPLRTLADGNLVSDTLNALVTQKIALYVAHTNLDVAPQVGVAVSLAAALGLQTAKITTDAVPLPLLGDLRPALSTRRLALEVGRRLHTQGVSYVGDPRRELSTVALVPGSGGAYLEAAQAAGAQAFLTGELDHHRLLEAQALGLTVILAGHRETERPVLDTLAAYLISKAEALEVHLASAAPGPVWLPISPDGGKA